MGTGDVIMLALLLLLGEAVGKNGVVCRDGSGGKHQGAACVGKCIDNGSMEGFWGILKRERYYGRRFTDRASLVRMIENDIVYYNYQRLQRNLGVLTPMQKHALYKVA